MTDVITKGMREMYPDDYLIKEFCDWIDQNSVGLSLIDDIFGRIRTSPAGWGITDVRLEMNSSEPARMTVELVQKVFPWGKR